MAIRKQHPPHVPCVWTRDDHDDSWDTDCGQKFQFTDGGPRENGMTFCCYCGRTLRVVK